MQQYLDMVEHILFKGEKREDRTGTGTLSVFGYQARYNLQEGFPLLTTKKVPFRIIFEELMWFLRGQTDLGYLLEKNVNIWNADAYRDYKEKGGHASYEEFIEASREIGYDLGPIYGAQWRSWSGKAKINTSGEIDFDFLDIELHDQLSNLVKSLQENPYSRRHILSAWNVGELEDMALPPCHIMAQFYVTNDGRLHCQLYQRSGDVFLGVPFNIASYSLLTHILAKITGYEVGEFIHAIGDAHIYLNHIEQMKTQLGRKPRRLPKLTISKELKTIEDIENLQYEDIQLEGYDPHPVLKGEVSVG